MALSCSFNFFQLGPVTVLLPVIIDSLRDTELKYWIYRIHVKGPEKGGFFKLASIKNTPAPRLFGSVYKFVGSTHRWVLNWPQLITKNRLAINLLKASGGYFSREQPERVAAVSATL